MCFRVLLQLSGLVYATVYRKLVSAYLFRRIWCEREREPHTHREIKRVERPFNMQKRRKEKRRKKTNAQIKHISIINCMVSFAGIAICLMEKNWIKSCKLAFFGSFFYHFSKSCLPIQTRHGYVTSIISHNKIIVGCC